MGLIRPNHIRMVRKYKRELGIDSILKDTCRKFDISIFNNSQITDSLTLAPRTVRPAKQSIHTSQKDKKWLGYIQIGAFFRDKTTKNCDVSIKPEGWNQEFVEFYPESYTRLTSTGKRTTKKYVELDYFEMENKGNGDGSKKIQEIINYAQNKTEGRMIVSAVQYQDKSPVLFYYKNGLRSTNPEINAKLEKIAQGELPKTELPENLLMYLPLKSDR